MNDALTTSAVERDHANRTDAQIALFARQAPKSYITVLRNADPETRKNMIEMRRRGEQYLEENGWNT